MLEWIKHMHANTMSGQRPSAGGSYYKQGGLIIALAELRMATANERKAKNKVARRARIIWSEDIVEVEGCR